MGLAVGGVLLSAAWHFLSNDDATAVVVNGAERAGSSLGAADRPAPVIVEDTGVAISSKNIMAASVARGAETVGPAAAPPPQVKRNEAAVQESVIPALPTAEPEPLPDTLYIERIDADLGDDGVYVISLWHNGPELDARALTLVNPSRFVVDLEGTWPYRKGNPQGKRVYGVGVVKRMRLGRVNKSLRVVVDILREQPFAYQLDSQNRQVVIKLWATSAG